MLIALAGTAAVLLNLNGCAGASGGSGGSSPAAQKIKHVVVIFQENRSTDNLFHDSVLMSRGADIATTGLDSQGETITLIAQPLVPTFDLFHRHKDFEAMYDNGKMDGADLVEVGCAKGVTGCAPPNPQFTYVDPSDVQPYFTMAETYTFGDRMFQTNQGPSFPAHQFIIAGTSAPTATSDLFAAENLNVPSPNAGCIAAPGITVALIDPQGNESSSSYPCYEHQTLTDLLDAKGITWRYYAPNAGSIWTGPDAIQHMCQPQTQNGQLVCTGSIWQNVIFPQSQVLKDISAGQLAQVSWVIPDALSSDHGMESNGTGPSWVSSVVNAIGNSQYWSDTAIFVTWDDWGGWYDHVAPKVINSYEYGFRVPLIVISPYAKAAYISHVTHDFGSILKFVEQLYGLSSLGYADVPADNFADCFNFNQTPLTFQTISAPKSAQDFLNDHTPPQGPDDD